MNCALWLNKRKVRRASEIRDNLDVAALRGYFLAGSLVEWLCENGGKKYAEKLSGLSPADPELNDKIAGIFGGKPVGSKSLRNTSEEVTEQHIVCGQSISSAVSSYQFPSSGSFRFEEYGSGVTGSFGSFSYSQLSSFREFLRLYGTSSFGSFSLGSYSQWEWLFRWFWQGYGSFYFGSFSSFHEWEWEWLFRLFFTGSGSFSLSSSSFGSYNRLSLFGFLSSFTGFGSFGSFNAFPDLSNFPVMDEYDRIMLETLMRCPLDRFGYGIHNI